jgi:exopolysaccharide biosynthesis polyprenyl glycosylphosphotransferase
MFRRYSTNFVIAAVLLDAVLVAGCLLLAAYLRPFLNDLPLVKALPRPVEIETQLILLSVGAWVINLFYSSMYDPRQNTRYFQEVKNLSLATIFAAATLAGALYLTYRQVSRLMFLMFIGLAFLALLTWRSVPWILAAAGIPIGEQPKTIILGAGAIGRELKEKMLDSPHFRKAFFAFLDDDREKVRNCDDVIATLDEVRSVVTANQVQDVIISLPRDAFNRVDQVVSELVDLPVRVWVVPDYFSLILQRAEINNFAGTPMLNLRAPALEEYQLLIKRGFDLVLGAVLILPAGVLMMLISMLLLIFEGRPILFAQQRVGENGKLFSMYKFRTMVPGAEQMFELGARKTEAGEHIYKHPDDPRVTSMGRLLRRTSLDELPQLFNVLKGEMSFVGPRPEIPRVVEEYQDWQRKRFSIPPGITGWWQITGRSEKPMHLATEDDLYYIQNYSLLMDIKILFLTVMAVLSGKGAY